MRRKKQLRSKQIRGFAIIINTQQGSMVIGSTFVVFFLLMLTIGGYLLAGGEVPTAFIRKDTTKRAVGPSPVPSAPCKPSASTLLEFEDLYSVNMKSLQGQKLYAWQ